MNDDDWQQLLRGLLCDFDGVRVKRVMLQRQSATWPLWLELCAHAFGICGPRNEVVASRLLAGTLRVEAGATAELKNALRSVAHMAALASGRIDVAEPASWADLLLCGFFVCRTDDQPGSPLLAAAQAWRDFNRSAQVIAMPVLLVRDAATAVTGQEQGAVANLTLRRMAPPADAPGGRWTSDSLFVAAPASRLLELDLAFAASLQRASRLVLSRLRMSSIDQVPFRLVWDLAPRFQSEALRSVAGTSAGAAFALAALGLCLDLLRGDPIRDPLADIDWSRAAVTAALADDAGNLHKIGGPIAKLEALREQGHRWQLQVSDLFVAVGQDGLRSFSCVHFCADIDRLAREVADTTGIEARYGRWPDVVAELHKTPGGASDPYALFVGRGWLTEQVQGALGRLDALPGRGGIVLVEADMLFGKTAWALRQVERTLAAAGPAAGAPELPLDGWAFARGTAGLQTDPRYLSANPVTVVAQLDACTRYRLGLSYEHGNDSARAERGRGQLHTLLKCCRIEAARRGRPIVLLVDGVDEAFDAIRLLLPPGPWPEGVQLILVGRASAFVPSALEWRPDCPIERALNGTVAERAHNLSDLHDFIKYRAEQIEVHHHRPMAAQELATILRACEGLFFVAAELLRDSDRLVSDLDEWQHDATTLPRGPRKAIERQLDRIEDEVHKRQHPALAVRPLLAFLACSLGGASWTADQLCHELLAGWPAFASADPLFAQAWLHAGHCALGEPAVAREILDCAADLMDFPPAGAPDSALRFRHSFVAMVLQKIATENGWAGPLHALWGLLCECAFAGAADAAPTNARALQAGGTLARHALLHGPMHLALATDGARGNALGHWHSAGAQYWRADCWQRAAWRLLDIRPATGVGDKELGYLQRLFTTDFGDAGEAPWHTVQQTIGVLLRAAVADPAIAAQIGESTLLLRSLRHALGDQHRAIGAGTAGDPRQATAIKSARLVSALHNRMATRWNHHRWGATLRKAVECPGAPALLAVEPPSALALGPILHRLGASISACAVAASGSHLAVGLSNGECWVWAARELEYGLPGCLAAKGATPVRALALAIDDTTGDWLLASGGGSAGVVVVTQAEVRRRQALGDDASAADAIDVLRLADHEEVTHLVLECDRGNRWWLAAGGDFGSVRVTWKESAERPWEVLQHGLIDHDQAVTGVALALETGGAWLATASLDGQSHVVRIEAPQGEWPMLASPLFATRHDRGITGLALSPGRLRNEWLMATAAEDGTIQWIRLSPSGPSVTTHMDRGHDCAVMALSLTRDGRADDEWWLASGDDDGLLRLTRLKQAEAGPVVQVRSNDLGRWQAAPWRHIAAWPTEGAPLLAVSDVHGAVRLVHEFGLAALATQRAAAVGVYWIKGAERLHVACCAVDGTVAVAPIGDSDDASTAPEDCFGEIVVCREHIRAAAVVAMGGPAAGGPEIATAGDDGVLALKGYPDALLRQEAALTCVAAACEESSGAQFLAVGDCNGFAAVVKVGQLDAGHETQALGQLHAGPVTSIAIAAFLRHGTPCIWVATGGWDGRVVGRLLDHSPAPRGPLTQTSMPMRGRRSSGVTCLAVLPGPARLLAWGREDGRVVAASVLDDGTLGEPRRLHQHNDRVGAEASGACVRCIAIEAMGAEGWCIASGGDDGVVRLALRVSQAAAPEFVSTRLDATVTRIVFVHCRRGAGLRLLAVAGAEIVLIEVSSPPCAAATIVAQAVVPDGGEPHLFVRDEQLWSITTTGTGARALRYHVQGLR